LQRKKKFYIIETRSVRRNFGDAVFLRDPLKDPSLIGQQFRQDDRFPANLKASIAAESGQELTICASVDLNVVLTVVAVDVVTFVAVVEVWHFSLHH
jgi:hypothetical protein